MSTLKLRVSSHPEEWAEVQTEAACKDFSFLCKERSLLGDFCLRIFHHRNSLGIVHQVLILLPEPEEGFLKFKQKYILGFCT